MSKKTKIIGLGQYGISTINDLISLNLGKTKFNIVSNTQENFEKFKQLSVDELILFKKEDVNLAKELVAGNEILFVTGSLGRENSDELVMISKIAKEMGTFVVALVSEPFTFEGKKIEEKVKKELEELKNIVDIIIDIPFDKLFSFKDFSMSLDDTIKEISKIFKVYIDRIKYLYKSNSSSELKAELENINNSNIKKLETIWYFNL